MRERCIRTSCILISSCGACLCVLTKWSIEIEPSVCGHQIAHIYTATVTVMNWNTQHNQPLPPDVRACISFSPTLAWGVNLHKQTQYSQDFSHFLSKIDSLFSLFVKLMFIKTTESMNILIWHEMMFSPVLSTLFIRASTALWWATEDTDEEYAKEYAASSSVFWSAWKEQSLQM